MSSTLACVWDASIAAWRITYINPVTRQRDELIGRRIGEDIVQVGTHQEGTPIRWNFTADLDPINSGVDAAFSAMEKTAFSWSNIRIYAS
jgi:hypothetical protein